MKGFAGFVRFPQQGKIDSKATICGFGSGDRLKDQVHGRAGIKRGHLRGDVREDAALRGDLKSLPQGINKTEQLHGHGGVVAGGIDANHGVAGTEQKSVENRSGDAHGIVSGMVGLKTRAEPAGQSYRGAKARDDADFGRGHDEVLHAHDLADGGRHFRRQARGQGSQPGGCCLIRQDPFAQLAHGEARDRRECFAVVRVYDQARDLVVLVGNYRLNEKVRQRHVSQGKLRGDSFFGRAGRDAGQHVSAAEGSRLRKQLTQTVERITDVADGMGEDHRLGCAPSE